jgi:hypothetical protein
VPVVGVEKDDVAGADPAEIRRELAHAERPWLTAGPVDRHRVGYQPVELDLIERVAAGDLVRRCVHMRPDVVPQAILRHRVTVLLHPRGRSEGRAGKPGKIGIPSS